MAHQDIPSLPGLVQMVDFRFSQFQQGIYLHLNGIRNNLDEKFKVLNDQYNSFFEEIRTLKSRVGDLEEDLGDIRRENRSTHDRVEILEKRLDNAEKASKACNVLFHNIKEYEKEDGHTTTRSVIDVLNKHSPSKSWHEDAVCRAYRIGRPQPWRKEPRPIVVQFCRWSDKMLVMGDKDLRGRLRASGIKVSADLTSHQRETVEHLRSQGKTAFYIGGRLHVHDNNRYNDKKERHREREDDWPAVRDSADRSHRDRRVTVYNYHSMYKEHSCTNQSMNVRKDKDQMVSRDRGKDLSCDSETGDCDEHLSRKQNKDQMVSIVEDDDLSSASEMDDSQENSSLQQIVNGPCIDVDKSQSGQADCCDSQKLQGSSELSKIGGKDGVGSVMEVDGSIERDASVGSAEAAESCDVEDVAPEEAHGVVSRGGSSDAGGRSQSYGKDGGGRGRSPTKVGELAAPSRDLRSRRSTARGGASGTGGRGVLQGSAGRGSTLSTSEQKGTDGGLLESLDSSSSANSVNK